MDRPVHKIFYTCKTICHNRTLPSITSLDDLELRLLLWAVTLITSASRYHPHYQNGSSMYIRGLIPRNFAELAEAVPIENVSVLSKLSYA